MKRNVHLATTKQQPDYEHDISYGSEKIHGEVVEYPNAEEILGPELLLPMGCVKLDE